MHYARYSMGSYTYHLDDFWNILDLFLFTTNYVIFGYKVGMNFLGPQANVMLNFDIQTQNYPNLEARAHMFNVLCNLNAFVLFGAYLKLVKFVNLSERVAILAKTFRSAAVDVGCFLVMFFCIFFAFAIMGCQMFGSNVYNFSSVGRACQAVAQMIMGETFFEDMWLVNRSSAVLFFILFVLMVVLFLMNVFIGIICTHYVNIKNECEVSFGEEISNMFHLLRKRLTSGPRFAGTQG
jgi:hypothetical protein